MTSVLPPLFVVESNLLYGLNTNCSLIPTDSAHQLGISVFTSRYRMTASRSSAQTASMLTAGTKHQTSSQCHSLGSAVGQAAMFGQTAQRNYSWTEKELFCAPI